MLDQLDRRERLRLMKFVCSFAWADLEIRPEERRFVARLLQQLELSEEDRRRVEGWLEVPPEPDAVDPTLVPEAHRKLFLEAIEGVIASDGEIAPEESESFAIFQQLIS